MLNKIASILFIPGMLGRKKKDILVLRTSKIFNLQTIDQVSCFVLLNNNDGTSKVGVGKMKCYSAVQSINDFEV